MSDEDEPGKIEASVRDNLARLGSLDTGVRASMSEMALKLARALDQCDSGDIASLSKLNSELRQTLNRLTGADGVDSDRLQALLVALSTPVGSGGVCANCGHEA